MADDLTTLVFEREPVPTPGPVPLAFGDDGPAPVLPGVHLTFAQPPVSSPGPVRLVFGDDGAPAPAIPDATLYGTGTITGLRLHITARAGARLVGTGRITGMRLHIAALYDINVSRPTVTQATARYQDAAPVQAGTQAAYRQALPLASGTATRWQDARTTSAAVRALWQDCERLATWARNRWQEAAGVPTLPVRAPYQEAQRLRTSAATRYQEAAALPVLPLGMRYQETLHLRLGGTARYQEAVPLRGSVTSRMGIAVPVYFSVGGRYQEAWPPRPGRNAILAPEPPQPDPCYLPVLPAQLVFQQPADTSLPARLVFICERHGPGPEPGATVVVPIRRVYMTINNVTLHRVDGNVPIPAYGFGMSLDVDSWTWGWQATLHADALPLIQPEAGGDPVDIVATINGVPYRLLAESYSRQRQFGNTRISVKGRGRAAMLDAPYAPVLNHGNSLDRTAQQLMADALTLNGVGIGWDVDWTLTDWLVPGNVWTHQGSYISALQDIAQAVGGYLQPHDTAQTLRVLRRYPAAPWDWATLLTPDYELPSAVVAVEGIDWRRLPAYDRVYVEGVKGGVRGKVTRAGTAGAQLAPMVVHPLITHADAARQRGIAELGNTGSQAHISLRLPVLEATGVIKPGALVRYVDGADTHLGLVRSTAVEWVLPTLRQVLTVETHLAE